MEMLLTRCVFLFFFRSLQSPVLHACSPRLQPTRAEWAYDPSAYLCRKSPYVGFHGQHHWPPFPPQVEAHRGCHPLPGLAPAALHAPELRLSLALLQLAQLESHPRRHPAVRFPLQRHLPPQPARAHAAGDPLPHRSHFWPGHKLS